MATTDVIHLNLLAAISTNSAPFERRATRRVKHRLRDAASATRTQVESLDWNIRERRRQLGNLALARPGE
jgi:hypothetical protein